MPDNMCPTHGETMPCKICAQPRPDRDAPREILVVHGPDGDYEFFVRNGLVGRCVTAVAHQNITDAKWVVEVLNRYGHLVPF